MTARLMPVSRTVSARLEMYGTCLAPIRIDSGTPATAGAPAMNVNAAVALRAPDSTGRVGLLSVLISLLMAIHSVAFISIGCRPRRGRSQRERCVTKVGGRTDR